MRLILLTVIFSVLFHSSYIIRNLHAASIQLPASGQSLCYNTAGAVIGCAGSGQDGEIRAGVNWDESNRFTNNGNGTVTDNLTGLIWLQNANCTNTVGSISKTSGYLNWVNALIWSNNLSSGKCGLTDDSSVGQWRLPTRNELESLVNRGQTSSATWLVAKGFSNVQANSYWSSSTYARYTTNVFIVRMDYGSVGSNINADVGYVAYVLPVRGGQ